MTINQFDNILDAYFKIRHTIPDEALNDANQSLSSDFVKFDFQFYQVASYFKENLEILTEGYRENIGTFYIKYTSFLKEYWDSYRNSQVLVSYKEEFIFFKLDFENIVMPEYLRINSLKNSHKLNEFEQKFKEIEKQSEDLKKNLLESEVYKKSLELQLEDLKKKYEPLNNSLELQFQESNLRKNAQNHRRNSINWLVGIIFFCFTLFGLLFYLKENFCFELSCYSVDKLSAFKSICENCGQQVLWLEMLKSVLFRLLLISVNLFLIKFSVQNYNASMHNKIINEVRENALNSAIHFYNTIPAEKGDKKYEILIKATDTIFTHRSTGYSKRNEEKITSSFIQDIIDKVTSK